MRLDHLAFRTANRWDTAKFWINAFGYRVQEQFKPFDDDSVLCLALAPPERISATIPFIMPLDCCERGLGEDGTCVEHGKATCAEYHIAPEIFVSDGKPGTVVDEWVKERGGHGGLHHMAYMVDDVEKAMKRWQANGWGNFLSDKPLTCPDIAQVFSKPQEILGGVLIEFIHRGERGFCKENVAELMKSTKNLDDGWTDEIVIDDGQGIVFDTATGLIRKAGEDDG